MDNKDDKNKLTCPGCQGKHKSKTHCEGGLCSWLTCGCGYVWDLVSGQGFKNPGPLKKLV
jgi:hypothetical protein